jgi:crotonobetainyl-CoA:carnitine CoA-transferase CaiB-like acyl-CoA transferase
VNAVVAPLAGRRVLDLGALCAQRPHALAASMAARLCAAYGAEVARPVPGSGEPFARLPPLLPDGGSALDRFLNAGKRRGPAATGAFDAAIGDSAALDAHAAAVPVRVRLSVFGPGEDPPMSELGLLALSGLLDIVGESDGPPARLAGHQPAYAAGLAACTGLLAALRGGGEEVVEVSLFDVTAWLNWKSPASVMVLGAAPSRSGLPKDWHTLPVRDGHVALVYQDKDWPALCDLIGDPRLRREEFLTIAGRRRHQAELMAVLRPWFAARSRAEITAAAQARRIPIGPVLAPAELLADAQHRARGFLGPGGIPHLPLRWDGARASAEASDAALA